MLKQAIAMSRRQRSCSELFDRAVHARAVRAEERPLGVELARALVVRMADGGHAEYDRIGKTLAGVEGHKERFPRNGHTDAL